MKEDKEIIDEIIHQLKNKKEMPYKEGAWEKFRSLPSQPAPKIVGISRKWYAAASIIVLFGLGMLWIRNKQDAANDVDSTLAQQGAVSSHVGQPTDRADDTVTQSDPNGSTDVTKWHDGSTVPDQKLIAYTERQPVYRLERINGNNDLPRSFMDNMIPELEIKERHIDATMTLAQRTVSADSHHALDASRHVMASTAYKNGTLNITEVQHQVQQKKLSLSDRLELGLFVSPSTTAQNMKMGGGFALSYKLNNVISLRTGASYNNYEVSKLKDPIDASSSEAVLNHGNSLILEGASKSMYQNSIIVPNVNAITGFVQSVDIPLEVKIVPFKSLYATAGLSYSAVINQRRDAHYIENVNTETFANGYPENSQQARDAVQSVTRTVESNEKNINTNGFGGFLNFSIGKSLKVNKSMGISVEPYFKVPVGQFRRADMDYTNGGIRIMTNF